MRDVRPVLQVFYLLECSWYYCSVPHRRSLSARETEKSGVGERELVMSVGSGEVGQGRKAARFTGTTKISPTLTPNSHQAPPTSTSVATIVLEQDDDDDSEVSSRGSEDSLRPLMDLDDPALIISPPPAFRNDDVINVDDSKSHPVYTEVSHLTL